MTAGIKWLFFDMGSILVDESRAYDRRIQDMIAGTQLSFELVHAKRLELDRQGLDGNSAVISYYGLDKAPWHGEEETLYPEAENVLSCLKERGYKLGIIANQAPGAEARLRDWGIADFFDTVASSAELGVAKPDAAIFEKALAMAGCTAAQAAMIGDRLDNDMAPAKGCGMHTVWLRSGLAAFQPRQFGEGCADAVIASLTELTGLFC